MTRFTYNGKTYFIEFICSYGGALSISGNPASDYNIWDRSNNRILRFSTDWDLHKAGIERTGLAQYKRERNNDFKQWASRNNFPNRGAARASIY